jgi:hypothetical protein
MRARLYWCATAQARHPRLVFDKVGKDRFLFELWFCDQAGLLLVGTKKAYEHEIVKDLQ